MNTKLNTGVGMTRRMLCRGAALAAAGALVGPALAVARPEPAAPAALRGAGALEGVRTIRLFHRGTGERYRGVYYEGGRYIPEAMAILDWLLRDVRAEKAHSMHPRLIDTLGALQRGLGIDELYVTSGYRCRETNEMLRRRNGLAARNSFHIEGMAADVYSPRIATRRLARAAQAERAGGVGFYPRRGFVHVDVGPRRSWRG